MTEDRIKYMVNRFLGWRLPENFAPDAGISFKPEFNEHTAHPMKHEPTGTNLLDATQAEAMVRHMVEGLSDKENARLREIEAAAEALSTAMVDSEEHGADYDLVDEQWIALTAALQSTDTDHD